jgi:hypothetical protein
MVKDSASSARRRSCKVSLCWIWRAQEIFTICGLLLILRVADLSKRLELSLRCAQCYEGFRRRSREGEQEAANRQEGQGSQSSDVNIGVPPESFGWDIVDCRVCKAVKQAISRQLFVTQCGRVDRCVCVRKIES